MSDWDGTAEGWGRGHYRDVPICRYAQLARDRQRSDLKRSLAGDPEFPYYYDDAAADRVIKFFSYLRHIEGEWRGQRFIPVDWQEWDILRPLFGWKRRDNGYRRFRSAYIEIPRRNSKSTIAAGIGDYMLIGDKEYRAQVYSAATKEDQARVVWGIARDMLKLSPELIDEVEIFKKSIYCPHLGSVFLPLGRDSRTQDGFSVHTGIIDEYHAHKTEEMRDVISSGRGSRRQALLFVITTAGVTNEGPCKVESDICKRILQGLIPNDEYFVYITTVDDPNKWDCEEEIIKANPNWGISVKPEQILSELKEAKQNPRKENEFKRKHLNLWTEQATKWLSLQHWDNCGKLIDPEWLKGKTFYGGLDLGISRDLSAFVWSCAGPMIDDPKGGEQVPTVISLAKFWMPQENIDKRYHDDGIAYPTWVEQGYITATPGETTRYDIIRKEINELAQQYGIAEIAIDRAHAHQLMVELEDDGFTIIKHSQGFQAMNFPCTILEELVLQERLYHGANPVMAWMASNAAILTNANEEIRIVKEASAERVDGIVAMAMSIGRLLVAPPPKELIYNSRPLYYG